MSSSTTTTKRVDSSGIGNVDKMEDPLVVFIPSNDTHVATFYPISKYLRNCKFLTFPYKNESAEISLDELGIVGERYSPKVLSIIKPDVVVVANDWGLGERAAISESRALGIPTVCVQEGPLDFTNSFPYRMGWADFVFIQGPIMTKFLDRESYFVTGNPRFDSIKREALPEKPLVVANLNFTYGVEEKHAENWLMDVVESCQELGLDFFISKHPRDVHEFPNLPVEKSNPAVVHEQLLRSSILVSRFSTLIYEAVLMGRDVVYYNPHGEKMRIFNEDDSGGIEKAFDKISLKNSLKRISRKPLNKDRNKFVEMHCNSSDGASSGRCARALVLIPKIYKVYKPRDIKTENLFSLRLKMFVFGVKNRLFL